MNKFTQDIVYITSTTTPLVSIYSVLPAKGNRKGLALQDNGKVFLVRSNGESGVWDQAGARGNAGLRFKADHISDISEEEFSEAMTKAQAVGVKNIGASAMRIVFAENNKVRSRYMGAANPRASFTASWVRFCSRPVAVDDLRALGATTAFLSALMANSITIESKKPVDITTGD